VSRHSGTRRGRIALAAAALMTAGGSAAGEVLISEIMYNPASDESPPNDVEWLELYNRGDTAVDLSGWRLRDEDGRTDGLPADTTLQPAEALVLIPGEQTVADFRAAWDTRAAVIALAGWQGPGGLAGLSNAPSTKNEMLELQAPQSTGSDASSDADADADAEGAKTPAVEFERVDAVNYDDTDPWPTDSPDGASIYLTPGHLNTADNDAGENWARSERYIDHAEAGTITADFTEQDVGSPGRVATEPVDATPEPAEDDPDADETEAETETDADTDAEASEDGDEPEASSAD